MLPARIWACGSGRRPVVAAEGFAGGIPAAGCQVSKSWVAKILPAGVRSNNWEPSAEYHTRSTGPEAKPARERSIKALPIWRHGPAVCPKRLADRATVAARTRTVALLYIELDHCNPIHRQLDPETTDSSASSDIIFS
jgi:hypothetical protein